MSVFEYASTILSIVIGLGVAHLLGGVSNIIRFARQLRIYWVLVGWIVVIVLVHIGWWYAVWTGMRTDELSFWMFLIPFLVSMLLYTTARLLTPDFDPKDLPDLHQHFQEVRVAFFILLTLMFVVAMLFSLVWAPPDLSALGSVEWALGVILMGLCLSGALVRDDRFHATLVIVWAVIYLAQQAIQPALS